jgi:hypothetical protein
MLPLHRYDAWRDSKRARKLRIGAPVPAIRSRSGMLHWPYQDLSLVTSIAIASFKYRRKGRCFCPRRFGTLVDRAPELNPYKFVDQDGLYPTAVHHEIDTLAFPSLSADDLAIVMQGSDYQDRWYAGQAPDQSYTHGQEDGFTYGMHEKERGDELMDRLLKAAHLVQDRTSWFHRTFPRWYGGLAPTDWFHGVFENLYGFGFRPGDVQQAVEATAPLISAVDTPAVTLTITFGQIEVVTTTITFSAQPPDPKEQPQ